MTTELCSFPPRLNLDGGPSSPRAEQRQQLRFPQGDAVRAHLTIGSQRAEAQVRDLSLGGAGLLLERERWRGAGAASLELRVDARPLGEVRVDLVHTEASQAGARLGVRFRQLDRRFLHVLCAYLVERHSQSPRRPSYLAQASGFASSEDRLRVRQLLVHCCRRRRPLTVCAGGERHGVLAPHAIRPDGIEGTLALDRGEPALGEATLVHGSAGGLALLPTRYLGACDGLARFALPDRILEGGRIRLGRLVVGEDFPVVLEFVHPQLSGRLVRKRVREVSFGGVRFDLDLGHDLLAPGTMIEAAVLRLPGGRSLPCRCVVRHTLAQEDGLQCGVELLDFRGSGRQLWIEQILVRLNPEVEEATPFTIEEAWEVFDRSGYLEEKPKEGLLALREPFLATWQKLLRGRDGARLWLHRGGRPAVGTISTTRVYSHTWLVHHLAVDRALPAARKLLVLADLAPRSAAQWLAGCQPDGHLLVYYDATTTFNASPYTAFFASRAQGGEVAQRSLRLRELPVDGPRAAGADLHAWVRPATPDELRRVSTTLRARDGELAHRAFDHAPETLARRDWAGSGLERWREVLIAGQGPSAPSGFAILEGAAPALNIFSLYDTVRVVLWERETSPAVLAAILDEVRGRYRALGRRSFLELSGEGDVELPTTPAFEAAAVRAVVSPGVLPSWLRHLEQLWGER
jgi:hypothetical protein